MAKSSDCTVVSVEAESGPWVKEDSLLDDLSEDSTKKIMARGMSEAFDLCPKDRPLSSLKHNATLDRVAGGSAAHGEECDMDKAPVMLEDVVKAYVESHPNGEKKDEGDLLEASGNLSKLS